jgi:hypothetical protein
MVSVSATTKEGVSPPRLGARPHALSCLLAPSPALPASGEGEETPGGKAQNVSPMRKTCTA